VDLILLTSMAWQPVASILKGQKPADLAGAAADHVRPGDQPQDREEVIE
jgi:hypothetical protein